MTIRKQSFQEFLVIGYDEDKQQFFCDLVAAVSKQTAVDKVSTDRDSVVSFDASATDELNNLRKRSASKPSRASRGANAPRIRGCTLADTLTSH